MTAPEVASEFAWRHGVAGPVLVCRPLETYASHLFSTRALRYRGDHSDADRMRVAAVLGVGPADLLAVAQVHGRDVAAVTSAAGLPPGCQADAVVTTKAGCAVSVLVADCVPILIADRHRRAVAAVHAGWRGTAAGVVGVAVARLMTMGVLPGDLVAAVGPSIGPCCYQVDAPVRQAFGASGSPADAWFAPDGERHWRLDLWRANQEQLTAAGVPLGSVHVARLCTAHHPDMCWSYRRQGAAAGRMVAAIRLRPGPGAVPA